MDDAERRRLLDEGAAEFRRGEFYEAHEAWEAVWNESDDPERRWVQGMIQIATGLHKLARDRPDVCRTLLEKALGKLADAPPAWEGFDLAALIIDARAVSAAIASGGRPDPRGIKLKRAIQAG